jgi:hypothetical protein
MLSNGILLYAQTAPSILGLTPNSGTGSIQTFTTTISDPNGTLSDVLFFVANGWNWPACYPYYQASTNLLYLSNDAGNGWIGGFAPLSGGSVSTSECTLSGAGSSVSRVGNTVTLNLALTFQTTFAGTWGIKITAWDSNGQNSGWNIWGSWTVPPVAITSLTPTSGTGLSQTFTTTISDPSGALSDVLFFVANGWNWPACYPYYQASTNLLYLSNDAGNGWIGGFAPLSGGSVSTSECTLSGAGSSVSRVGSTVTLKLALTFQTAFAGTWGIKITAWDSNGQNSGWTNMGSWTVPSAPVLSLKKEYIRLGGRVIAVQLTQ